MVVHACVVPALRRDRQENHKFQASLCYNLRLSQGKKKKIVLWDWGYNSVVEYLPRIQESLSLFTASQKENKRLFRK
jgi:hypothetical protein